MSNKKKNADKLKKELKEVINSLEKLLIGMKEIEAKLSAQSNKEAIQIGDRVHSINKPYDNGIVTCFSKGNRFVFIKTGDGSEQYKAPKYVRKGPRD